MRVLGVSGSPRAGGNTDLILNEALKSSEAGGANEINPASQTTNLWMLHGVQTGNCVAEYDWKKLLYELIWADGIILGSPISKALLSK